MLAEPQTRPTADSGQPDTSSALAANRAIAAASAVQAPPAAALTEAIFAAAALTAEVYSLERIHAGLDEACVNTPRDVVIVPAELIVDHNPDTVVRTTIITERVDGSVKEGSFESQRKRELKTRAEILAYHDGDTAKARPMLNALRRYQRAVKTAPRATADRLAHEAEEVWQEARHRQMGLIEDILKVPVSSAADAATKLETFIQMMGEGCGLDFEDDLHTALDAARADLAALAGRQITDSPGRAVVKVWTEALAGYQSAKAARDAAAAVDRAETLAINLKGPEGLRSPGLIQDQGPIWHGAACLQKDVLLTDVARRDLAPKVDAWREQRSALINAIFAGDPNRDTDFADIHDAYDRAANRLLATQPPSPVELVLQQTVYAQRLAEVDDDSSTGLDDLGWCAWKSDDCWLGRPMVEMFRNTVRMAGLDHPALHMEPFSPREWVTAYEEAGGMVSDAHQGLLLIPDDGDTKELARLRAQLDAAPYRYWAVQLHAEERAGTGGDPIHDSGGEFGANDRRGGGCGGQKFYGTVSHCDLVHFVRDPDGGAPMPIIRRIGRGRA